jgi:ribosomal protein L7Ae-like RNA K-turn-binding protein
MNPDAKRKIQQHLGLCLRAGRLISGEELVLDSIKHGKAKFVLLSEDASENTRKRITDKCTYYKIPFQQVFTRSEIGEAIGKAERVVIAITDQGFAKLLRGGLKNSEVNSIDESSR